MDASGDLGWLKNAPPPDDREEIGSVGEPAMTDTMAAFIEAAWRQLPMGVPPGVDVAAIRTQLEANTARLEAEAAMAEEAVEARAALDAELNSITPSFRAAAASYADERPTPRSRRPNGADGRPIPSHEGEAPIVWADPQPLPDGLLPVAPFDMAFLPQSLAPWIADTADRMQCPVDFVAIPAMIALGSVLGRKIGVRPQRNTDWFEVPNLWGFIVGPPGAMKSPAMGEAMKPLRRLGAIARQKNERAAKAYAISASDYKTRTEASKSKFKTDVKKNPDTPTPLPLEEPVEPKARRYIVDDATYEALGVILVDNPSGVLAYRDELVSLLKTLEREDYAAARGFFLASWGGKESYSFDRIIRGSTHIEAACVALLGATQPGKIGPYVGRAIDGGEGDDGMIQRFSMSVWPDQCRDWREVDRYADSEARERAWETFKRLDELTWQGVSALKDPSEPVAYLKFDAAAQRIFSRWHRDLETLLREGDGDLSPALKGHFSKYKKLVPALALINHLADGGSGEIGEEALTRAINFSRYLGTHAKRIYAAGSQNETTAAKAILARIKLGELSDGFTARDIQRRGWSTLTNKEHIKAGLELLLDLGWLADKTTKKNEGGRPSVVYSINPTARR